MTFGDIKKIAVIGHPIKHSISPVIHNHWIEKYNLTGAYSKIDIAPENLKEKMDTLIHDQGYAGFNITVPHKQSIMKFCDKIDDTARAIGAVNTISVDSNGKILGYNTDAYGFIQNMKSQLPDITLAGTTALVLGAGGAARAIIFGLLKAGVEKIIIANRTFKTAKNLQKTMNAYGDIDVITWDEIPDELHVCGMVINTTVLGMVGHDDITLDFSVLNETIVVADIVYTPLMTGLLKDAQNNDHKIVTGLGMLLQQARPAFEHWFGILPDIDDALVIKVSP